MNRPNFPPNEWQNKKHNTLNVPLQFHAAVQQQQQQQQQLQQQQKHHQMNNNLKTMQTFSTSLCPQIPISGPFSPDGSSTHFPMFGSYPIYSFPRQQVQSNVYSQKRNHKQVDSKVKSNAFGPHDEDMEERCKQSLQKNIQTKQKLTVRERPEIILREALQNSVLFFSNQLGLTFCMRNRQFVVHTADSNYEASQKGVVPGLVIHQVIDADGSSLKASDVKDLTSQLQRGNRPLTIKFCHPDDCVESQILQRRRPMSKKSSS